MANSNSKPAADSADVKTGTVKVSRENDLTATGRNKTEVSTETKVEDRTAEPARHMVTQYHSEDVQLDGGTVLTHYTAAKASK